MARKADPDRKNNIVQSAIPAFAQKGYAAARIVDAVHLDRVKRKSCPLPKAMQAKCRELICTYLKAWYGWKKSEQYRIVDSLCSPLTNTFKRDEMKEIFPDPIRKLPKADIPIEGLEAYLSHSADHQLVFMQFEKDVDLPEHAHAAQDQIRHRAV